VVFVTGLVIGRQRPGTASGVTFVTLEDETGMVNLILQKATFADNYAVARHAKWIEDVSGSNPNHTLPRLRN
jgi:error-prone DNA polymerase